MRALNFCERCFEKQRKIDELTEELQRLRGPLNRKERKEGPFGSSTPSSQKPFKPNTPEEEKKNGGAARGHKGHGRAGFTPEEADREEEVFLSMSVPIAMSFWPGKKAFPDPFWTFRRFGLKKS